MLWANKVRGIARKNNDLLQILSRRYPRFILNDSQEYPAEIPVFTFHQETVNELEAYFGYLCENGYRTLTADELHARLVSGDRGTGKEVVLTFDDGASSFWSVVYPLLKKYGLTVVAFIVPGLIYDQTTGTGWEAGKTALCSWSEIQAMHESRLIDFQVHSLYHHSIFVSSRVIGYVAPTSSLSFLEGYLFPIQETEQRVVFPDELPLGTPLYESFSRFGAMPRYFDSESLREACCEFVRNQGGSAFFRRKYWRSELEKFARPILRQTTSETRYESEPRAALLFTVV
jgi:hypothetical protein